MGVHELARARIHYGYRKILVLLNGEGWNVGKESWGDFSRLGS
jgi:hypothetical protein